MKLAQQGYCGIQKLSARIVLSVVLQFYKFNLQERYLYKIINFIILYSPQAMGTKVTRDHYMCFSNNLAVALLKF